MDERYMAAYYSLVSAKPTTYKITVSIKGQDWVVEGKHYPARRSFEMEHSAHEPEELDLISVFSLKTLKTYNFEEFADCLDLTDKEVQKIADDFMNGVDILNMN